MAFSRSKSDGRSKSDSQITAPGAGHNVGQAQKAKSLSAAPRPWLGARATRVWETRSARRAGVFSNPRGNRARDRPHYLSHC